MKRNNINSNFQKKRTDENQTPENPDEADTMEYEDPTIDEYENEETHDAMDEDATGIDIEKEDKNEQDEKPNAVFRVGKDSLVEGEELDYDSSAYIMYHALNVEWPCLSFDVVNDNLGLERSRFPMTLFAVGGTQAENENDNKLVVMKMFDMYKTKFDEDPEEDDDGEGLDTDAQIMYQCINHKGAINRVRCMPDSSQIVATWSEKGSIDIYDVTNQLTILNGGNSLRNPNQGAIYSYSHSTEGYAMDWNRKNKGLLATGDNNGNIYLHTYSQSGWSTNKRPFTCGNGRSIEDIQWSTDEDNVFATCSSDRYIRIWDTRSATYEPVLSVLAHDDDVNVISWNKLVGYLMVSGSDDNSFKVWDLRAFKNENCVYMYNNNYAGITSVEWSPSESSVLAVTTDSQMTLWDLSLESDSVENQQDIQGLEDLPQQLLFEHGQEDIKEVHFHSQIPGCLVTTALSGFNVVIPDVYTEEQSEDENEMIE
ncbi:hypothetical protein WA158_007939 [Blastocystis sp. Blastoise]